MTTNELHPGLREDDDDATAALLRLAGPRTEVAADRSTRVRQAVHVRWRAATRRRAIRRRTFAATVLFAAAAVVVLAVRLTTPREEIVTAPGAAVASVEGIEGNPRRVLDAGAPTMLVPADRLRIGEWVETDGTARASLRLLDGTALRLDRGSRVRLISKAIIDLAAGGLYLDTGRDSTGLEVRTRFGTARDIGTQFELRLTDIALRLRVRTGLVELRSGERSATARSGTEVTVAARGIETRLVPVHGAEWEWISGITAPFEIEGRPLAALLDHLCREHGWTLRYADAALARDASSIILHGSINGLRAEEALSVALTTSGLEYRLIDGELFVFRGVRS